MFRIFPNINSISYSFRSIANQTGVRYSDSTSYFKKYSSSTCKQTVCLHYGLDFHFKHYIKHVLGVKEESYNPGQNICDTSNYLTKLHNIIANLEKPPPYPRHSVLIAFVQYGETFNIVLGGKGGGGGGGTSEMNFRHWMALWQVRCSHDFTRMLQG